MKELAYVALFSVMFCTTAQVALDHHDERAPAVERSRMVTVDQCAELMDVAVDAAIDAAIDDARAVCPSDVTPLGTMRVFNFTCTTTGQPITDGGNPFEGARLFNSASTSVFIGGSDVDTSTKGVCIGTSASCIGTDIPVTGKTGVAWCRVAAGTQAIVAVVGAR